LAAFDPLILGRFWVSIEVNGQALANTSERDPRSYMPKHLAEKILTSRSALEGARPREDTALDDLRVS
jgi:hypothetical protein